MARAATLHDVGKIGVNDVVLNKPGRLSEQEFALIKSHAAKGYAILRNAPSLRIAAARAFGIITSGTTDGGIPTDCAVSRFPSSRASLRPPTRTTP